MPDALSVALAASDMAHHRGDDVTFHQHMHGQLSVTLEGTLRLQTETGWWLATPGNGVWVPPGQLHRALYTECSRLINLRFRQGFELQLPAHSSLIVASNLLTELAKEALAIQQTSGSNEQLELIAQLLHFQLRKQVLKTDLFVPEGKDKRLRLITSLLREDPACSKTLVELASVAFISPRTLGRLFESEIGMSFTRWRERMRIISSVEQLVNGVPITQVAYDMGYQSASSFTTAFTRIIGLPPGRYLKETFTPDKS
ncbi:helix-turn-helix transcriptional regulator [Cedecea neteri]|uniref:helix-turn-helix domain-containing protein n=1 Tax=Cedecea neteri TaxID=158822 RepID=UPI002AA66B96|nr:helix-turn-helix transcriptional regulator [Cedecea neteri]WPU25079.1 helix-turn-helix transcriptional regulator [Cedecea neteri]